MADVQLHTLKPAAGSRKRRKRIGRGQGSGHGGTSTRGHKGAGARAGANLRPWFEGGQMPLIRRVPKFGFHSPFKVRFQVVNLSTLEALVAAGKISDGKVTPELLYQIGTISKKAAPVKVLGEGELKSKLEIAAHAFSKTAAQKIAVAGGKILVLTSQAK